MNWLLFAELLVRYGLPFAEEVWRKVTTGGDITQADIDALKALAANTAQSQLLAAALRAGVTPDNPFVQSLLGMIPATPTAPPNPT